MQNSWFSLMAHDLSVSRSSGMTFIILKFNKSILEIVLDHVICLLTL